MYDTRVRDSRLVGQFATAQTASSPLPANPSWSWSLLFANLLGSYQSVYSYRGAKPKTKMLRLLNPHPCVMYRSAVESFPFDSGWVWKFTKYYCRAKGEVIPYALSQSTSLAIRTRLPLQGIEAYDYLMGRALHECYSKAKLPSMPSFVYLGELKETLRTIVNPLSGIRSLLKFVFRKKRGSLRSIMNDISSQWLEYRYGIMPMVFQVQEIISAFEKKHQRQVVPVRDGVVHEEVFREHFGLPLPVGLIGTCKGVTTRTVSAHVALATRMRDLVPRRYGTSWSDVPSAVWELIPLSFVIDWFYDVGDWLQAITPDPSLKVLRSSISVTETRKFELDMYRIRYLNSPDEPVRGKYVFTESRLNRIVDPNLPVLPVPKKEALSLFRKLDSVSLVLGHILNLTRRK